MFLVTEEQDPTCSCLNPSILFISKAHGLKARGISCYLVQYWSEVESTN